MPLSFFRYKFLYYISLLDNDFDIEYNIKYMLSKIIFFYNPRVWFGLLFRGSNLARIQEVYNAAVKWYVITLNFG